MLTAMILLMISFLVISSLSNSFVIHSIESDEDSRMPRASIETFVKLILRYCGFTRVKRGLYLVALRLTSIFVSNPTINSKTYRTLSGEIKARSDLRESPVISETDGKVGRSTYTRQCCTEENDLEMKNKTEL